MYDKVKTTISKHKMIETGDKIVVGVSGGPDSVALAHILAHMARETGFSLHIAHLNHMFRGRDAEVDSECVASLAAGLGVSYTIEKVDVPAIIKERHISVQAGAREVRYAFFSRVMEATGANKIATGHHADDQVESVLMNILRGSGLAGLSGIPPVRGKIYIRPLIDSTRQEINNYCIENGLSVRHDKSNDKNVYLRNRVRNELLPYLRDRFNPNIAEALVRLSAIVRDDDAYIGAQADQLWDQLVSNEKSGEYLFFLAPFIVLPLAIQRRLLMKIWGELTGSDRDLMYSNVEQLLDFLANGSTTGWLELPKGYKVRKVYGKAIFMAGKKPESPIFLYPLKVPGEIYIPELGIQIITELFPMGTRQLAPGIQYVDFELLPAPLCIRNRRPGDRFKPLGMKGTKKLKDFFIDLKIPAEQRHRYPVIVAGEELVCIAGLRIDDRWKVSERTVNVLGLKIINKIES